AVGGADGRGDLPLTQPRFRSRSRQYVQPVRGGDAALGETARGPEQAPVAFALTTGGDPRRQPGHIRLPRHATAGRSTRWAGVEEVPQPVRIQAGRGAGVDRVHQIPNLVAFDELARRRGDDVAAVAAEVDPGTRGLPGPLLRLRDGWEVGVHPARRGPDQELPSVYKPGPVRASECLVTVDRAVHVDVYDHDTRCGTGGQAD